MNRFICILFLVVCVSLSLLEIKADLPTARSVETETEPLYTPNSSILFAYKDLQTCSKSQYEYIRYLSLYNIPKAKRKEIGQSISFLINSLSRDPTIKVPEYVIGSDDTEIRVNLYDYDIPVEAWEKLGKNGSGIKPFAEPYFHKFIEKQSAEVVYENITKYRTVTKTAYNHNQYGQLVPYSYTEQEAYVEKIQVGTKKIGKPIKILITAPWLDPVVTSKLISLTQSEFPVLRADWFIANASLPPAYYNLIGLDGKNAKKDFDAIVFADEKKAAKARSVIKGVAVVSTVARNNRALLRSPTFTGGYYWISHDTKTSTDERDYVRFLIDEKFDAQEIVASAPNKLQLYGLYNDKDLRQDEVPNNIAIDNTASDRVVRNGRSCIICHSLGLQVIEDEVRIMTELRTSDDKLKLFISDEKQFKRFRDLYSTNLKEVISTDQTVYAKAVREATGLLPDTNATQFSYFYDKYAETLLNKEDVAREVGVSPENLEAFIAKTNDPHILGLTKNPIRPLRRDQWEQSFQDFMLIVYPGGVVK